MKETMPKRIVQIILLSFVTLVSFFDPTTIFGQGIVRQIDAPGPSARGLTWDGQYLWCGDAVENRIFKIDPATGEVVHSIPFEFNGTFGGGLAWNGDGTLWTTRMWYFHKLDALTGDSLTAFYNPYG